MVQIIAFKYKILDSSNHSIYIYKILDRSNHSIYI